MGLAMIWANAFSWGLEDWRTYLLAAERVADGNSVYDWTAGPESVYRYAPWFAYALVPFLALPRSAADLLWSAIVLGGVLMAALPLIRQRTWAAVAIAILGAGLLMRVASTGNVNSLMIGALVLGINSRFGPLIVALAASLKATPLLFVAVFVAERRWVAAGVTGGITLILVAPMVWLGYEATPGPSDSLFGQSVVLWALVAAVATSVLGILTLRRSRFVGLAAGTAAFLALPRAFLYDIALVLPGATARRREARSASRRNDR